MGIQDLFQRAVGAVRPSSTEVEGTIEDMRVVRREDREHWLMRLNTRQDAVFCFWPTPLSPPRRKGERVRVAYAAEPGRRRRLRAEHITAA